MGVSNAYKMDVTMEQGTHERLLVKSEPEGLDAQGERKSKMAKSGFCNRKYRVGGCP